MIQMILQVFNTSVRWTNESLVMDMFDVTFRGHTHMMSTTF